MTMRRQPLDLGGPCLGLYANREGGRFHVGAVVVVMLNKLAKVLSNPFGRLGLVW
jgi:hypothetical protein